ncbi:MAG: 50S ribosomal protein L19e [Candidatus Micrarchaeota archaeon]|nr:50S ribosomal protein L19e [Candidatus Micrarchaeota archaeon]
MSIKLTRRIAAELMKRGESKVRIKPDKADDAKKAITREDVRALIANGSVYAIKEKHNLSLYSKELRVKRNKGRRRGPGRRKGSAKARQSIDYVKKIRGQRRVLAALKQEKSIDNEAFKRYYRLVKGGNFQTKGQLLSHLTTEGVKIDQQRLEKLRHM